MSFLQLVIVITAVAGSYLVAMLNLPVPADAIEWLNRNKMGIILGAFFAGNMVNNSLMGTGAFEVYFDGAKIFSKLATGHAPVARIILDRMGQMLTE